MVINFRSLSEVSHLRIDTLPFVVGGVLLFFLPLFYPNHNYRPSTNLIHLLFLKTSEHY